MTCFSTRPVPDPVVTVQESGWDYPRPPRLETSHTPNYYSPPDDVAPGAVEPCKGASFCEWKGRASYFTVRAADRVVTEGAWAYEEPSEAFAAIRGHLA